jgi:hypothetical protein
MRSGVASHRAGTLPAAQVRFPRLLAESLADHIQSRALADGLAPTRYALLWTESRIGWDSGARSDRIVALLRWHADRADGEGQVFVAWSPDERTLRQHWPAVAGP